MPVRGARRLSAAFTCAGVSLHGLGASADARARRLRVVSCGGSRAAPRAAAGEASVLSERASCSGTASRHLSVTSSVIDKRCDVQF